MSDQAPEPRIWVVSRSDMRSKLYAWIDKDGDVQWLSVKDKAHRFTETEADIFVHEFNKYSDTELDIEGAKPVHAAEQAAA